MFTERDPIAGQHSCVLAQQLAFYVVLFHAEFSSTQNYESCLKIELQNICVCVQQQTIHFMTSNSAVNLLCSSRDDLMLLQFEGKHPAVLSQAKFPFTSISKHYRNCFNAAAWCVGCFFLIYYSEKKIVGQMYEYTLPLCEWNLNKAKTAPFCCFLPTLKGSPLITNCNFVAAKRIDFLPWKWRM